MEYIQQLPEPSFRPHVAYVLDVHVDPHISSDERWMLGGEHRVDVDGAGWIDQLVWSADLALQHVQELPEPPLGSHLHHQRGIRLHPFGLAHGWLMLPGQLGSNSDGVERIDVNALQVVFRELWHAYLLPFGNAVQLYHLLSRYSLETREKGKQDTCPTLYSNDSRPNSTLAHQNSRDPHEISRESWKFKGGKACHLTSIIQPTCHTFDKIRGNISLLNDAMPATIHQGAHSQCLQGKYNIRTS